MIAPLGYDHFFQVPDAFHKCLFILVRNVRVFRYDLDQGIGLRVPRFFLVHDIVDQMAILVGEEKAYYVLLELRILLGVLVAADLSSQQGNEVDKVDIDLIMVDLVLTKTGLDETMLRPTQKNRSGYSCNVRQDLQHTDGAVGPEFLFDLVQKGLMHKE